MSPHTFPQMILLAVLLLTDLLVTFSLVILYCRTVYSTCEGYTTIESWEQDRHDALVRQRRVRRQQFPYDVGIWDNLCSAYHGNPNVLSWVWPLARTKAVGEEVKGSNGLRLLGGLEYEVNGYEELGSKWPPPDPDKSVWRGGNAFAMSGAVLDESSDWADGVRRRQWEDMRRREWKGQLENLGEDADRKPKLVGGKMAGAGAADRKWMNGDGETLADYGVDEDEEEVGEDEDVPLAELMRRRAGGR